MPTKFQYNIIHPALETLGYIVAVANITDKHDRSAPSDYHWKILKCRMIIFSNSSFVACPDQKDVKQVHIIFNKLGDDYDKLISLFEKYSLIQDGEIKVTTPDIFQMCFQYTMTAKIAPIWNTLGYNYLINNRDFLIAKGPHDGVEYEVSSSDNITIIKLKAIKINFIKPDEKFSHGELVRVMPSLNKARIEECYDILPTTAHFKTYKDLRRHWKNIHGYRLPEKECPSYYTVQFWRGDPLTYPEICLTRNYPIITPIPNSKEKCIISNFLSCLKNKLSYILGMPLMIQLCNLNNSQGVTNERFAETQAVSLCTPTQAPHA